MRLNNISANSTNTHKFSFVKKKDNESTKQTSFGTSMKYTPNPLKKGDYLLDQTNMFRTDLDWEKFAEMIKQKFTDLKIFCQGCSDGSEAFSLRLILDDFLGKSKSEKIKIFASDINPKNIEQANDGYIYLTEKDENKIVQRQYNK